MRVSLCYTMQI